MVIGIIAVLAAIVLPVYNNAQERARQSQCLSNLSGVAVAMKLYRNDYRRFPMGALANNGTDLSDGANFAYADAAYNTFDVPSGRRTRIHALYPNYIEDGKSLLCPDEDGESALIDGANDDPPGAYNGFDSPSLLSLDNDLNGDGNGDLDLDGDGRRDVFVSTYDDFYNVFGYVNADFGAFGLGAGTPRVTYASQIGGGREAPRLNNPYAPGSTIITYCREHESFYKSGAEICLAVRLAGNTDRIVRSVFDWNAQAEQGYD